MAQAKPLTDAQWRAQHDAQVLMEADEILKNKPRMVKAKGAAKVLVKDKKSEVRSLEKVIKKKSMNTSIKPYKRKGSTVPTKRNKRK